MKLNGTKYLISLVSVVSGLFAGVTAFLLLMALPIPEILQTQWDMLSFFVISIAVAAVVTNFIEHTAGPWAFRQDPDQSDTTAVAPSGYVLPAPCVKELIEAAEKAGVQQVTFGVMVPGEGVIPALPGYRGVICESVERLRRTLEPALSPRHTKDAAVAANAGSARALSFGFIRTRGAPTWHPRNHIPTAEDPSEPFLMRGWSCARCHALNGTESTRCASCTEPR